MTGDPSAILNGTAWDAQAQLALPTDAPMAPGRMQWTQYVDHGPGVELLGDVRGLTVVELGCGNGDNLAPLAARGALCTGVDLAANQIKRANTRWGHLPMRFVHADARTFLTRERASLDICFSVFGAIGHCPPEQLLPLIAARLRPGGRLIFSVADRRWLGHHHRDELRLPDGTRLPVARWTLGGGAWRAVANAAGFQTTRVDVIQRPNRRGPCCIIVTAKRPSPARHRA
jgi:SAM-dependent methyltransferase